MASAATQGTSGSSDTAAAAAACTGWARGMAEAKLDQGLLTLSLKALLMLNT